MIVFEWDEFAALHRAERTLLIDWLCRHLPSLDRGHINRLELDEGGRYAEVTEVLPEGNPLGPDALLVVRHISKSYLMTHAPVFLRRLVAEAAT